MSRLSLRLRLTIWYSTIVTIVVLTGVVLTLVFMRSWMLRPIDREIAFQVSAFGKAAEPAKTEAELETKSRQFLSSSGSEELRNLGYILFVWTSSGSIVSNASTAMERFPESQQVFGGGPGFTSPRSISSPSGDAYRAAIVPISEGGKRAGMVIVAAPMAQFNEHLRGFAFLFGALGLAAIIGSAVGTWFLLGRAFQPVETITETALAFSRDDPSGRITYEGPPDEIGRLVFTLNDMLDRVERSFRDQQQFLYDASHELRTPLSIVKGHLEVLEGDTSASREVVKDAHQVVLAEIDRMNRLVAGLLTLARSGEKGFLEMEDLRLDEFLETLFASAVALGERQWTLDPIPPLTVHGDADRLTQVMLNLLRNAVEHTLPGDRIVLGAAPDNRWARIWVRDEGEGIPPERLKTVFDRFYSQKRRDGGHGLGLSIAEALVKAHGGRIEVTSTEGEGATFTVLLPASEQAELDATSSPLP